MSIAEVENFKSFLLQPFLYMKNMVTMNNIKNGL